MEETITTRTSTGRLPLKNNLSTQDKQGIDLAYAQAQKSYNEKGIPIGSCLINNSTGEVLGVGHNERIQKQSAILHGEMSCLENAGRLPAKIYQNCTLYSSLSPCHMCSGAILLYGIKRVVIGENENFMGPEKLVRDNGVDIINVHDDRCKLIMREYIKNNEQGWNEDIGE
ncbi:unnamed protein product [Candida verbasci]|uniref:Cytosine deaminase n=1 Tax=Candida verbasci TaxID=1227364 RepID=A0A9W4TY71_9ASCO|nr:unnamed protein product [Candida verbasci]